MTNKIMIEQVTRIEGHAKVSIFLNDEGSVQDAQVHVTQVRGFEKFVQGRPFYEMPSLTARTCGICPVSHLIASSKACDQILAVRIPTTAIALRRIINLGQIIQSHALNFFYLSSPDLLLGMDGDPARRNMFGMFEKHPQIVRDGIRLRQFGQQVIERLANKRVHPSWIVPGGVASPLEATTRDQILSEIPEVLAIITRTLDWYKKSLNNYQEYIRTFANFPSLFMGLVTKDGRLEHYHGNLRVVTARGSVLADQLAPDEYESFIGEAVEPYTYLKSPYYKPLGYADGMYRVGPLARLNVANECGTPQADQELAEFHCLDKGAVLSSFHYHYARLIEILYGIERIQQLLNEPDILSDNVRAHAEVNSFEGIGVSEAPRGTLFHHYKVNEDGIIQSANLIIASGNNNLAMNKGVLQAARYYVRPEKLTEGMLNRVEAVIRAFDPCLACSTHADGHMAMQFEMFAPDGKLLDTLTRD
ncbi:MAG: Ni/Fe hydrogenase subunit alpha [Chloroflexi bacterium]|nr:Ni/Fe hydrogenase subunit alpha [Chloroflexota bacterium]